MHGVRHATLMTYERPRTVRPRLLGLDGAAVEAGDDVAKVRTCVLCERHGTGGFEPYAHMTRGVLWRCQSRAACDRRRLATDGLSEVWDLGEVAAFLGISAKSADSALRRWGVKPVGRGPGRAGSNRYLASEVRRAHRTRPLHVGVVYYDASAPRTAHVAQAMHPRSGRNSGYHAVLDQDVTEGRLVRSAGDPLCRPARTFYALRPEPDEAVTCPRCRQLAERLLVAVGGTGAS